MSSFRYAFAGDRGIAVQILKYLLDRGEYPCALLTAHKSRATHDAELRKLCADLDESRIIQGKEFRNPANIEKLRALEPDLIVGIHFPYMISPDVLAVPKIGVVNLHPALLPFCRGWHTPSWAILEGTPFGATLHFMDEGMDTGDIIHQIPIEVRPDDTANSLYQRVNAAEIAAFQEAWPRIVAGDIERIPQGADEGTTHKGKDLFREEIQRINLDETASAGELIDKLRGLTTNRLDEAAYFCKNGKRYRVQVTITEDGEA